VLDVVGNPAGAELASGPAGAARHLNRHLSWLEFNARVLALAADPELPALERAKFLAIFRGNLDEFFQVRVGGLAERLRADLDVLSPDGLSAAEQLRAIRGRVVELVAEQTAVFGELAGTLDREGVRLASYATLSDTDRAHLDRVFEDRVFPVLTPLAVDPAHPFPYISNLSLNLAVKVGISDGGGTTAVARVARVKVPPLLPRFVLMPDGERFVPLEQVIAAHLGRLFPGMRILGHYPFRVTRNAEFALEEEETLDLLSAVEGVLRMRRRSPRVVRLEVGPEMCPEVLDLLMRELDLTSQDVYTDPSPLDLSGMWALHGADRPDLKEARYQPVTQRRLQAPSIFEVLRRGDVLVHHPYESFATSAEAFIVQAARDPDVLAIKQTLYRTSGPESPIVRALIEAAESGKQVVVLVELTARFDEAANIAWARALEQAGVHVVHGMIGLKTHAKAALVVRREATGIRRYCHVGTGNYNPQTALLYEDLGLLSADPDLGADLTDLFNYLTGYSQQRRYRRLLVAPLTLRQGLLDLIRREARPGGRIVIKVNHLVDPEMVEALYDASRAGADIDLIVRSSCGLRPGVPGMSDRIRVRSIVGRFLEHSRLFSFGPDGDADWLIGSADLMQRNLDHRVEAVVPIVVRALRERLPGIVDVLLADDALTWELGADGAWRRASGRSGMDAHRRLMELGRGLTGVAG
jgi:polyphosphate kinase